MARLLAHRLFFALLPVPQQARRIAITGESLGPGNPVSAEHLHVTLAILKETDRFDAFAAERMKNAAEAVAAEPFRMVLDQLSAGSGTIALRPAHAIAALKRLHRQLGDAIGRMALTPRPGWRFSPHMTLLYRDAHPFTRPVSDLGWNVAEFVLVHSHVGLTRHDILGRWPLRGGPVSALLL